MLQFVSNHRTSFSSFMCQVICSNVCKCAILKLNPKMSRRVFEFRPDNRHRDWRLAGRGNRHRCGDCSGQEDGQILVSTSPL